MSDRTVFITSGATGLGYAIVEAMLEDGWDVFFTYRNSEENARSLVDKARSMGRRAQCCRADLLNRAETLAAVDQCLQEMQRVDAFVHNFGPFVFERISVADYPEELWNNMVQGNLANFLWVYQRLIPHMRARRFGRIVTMGFDGAGEAVGWRFRGPYAAAKSALASLTRTIAREEREHGITANMVCPGDIRGQLKSERIQNVLANADLADRPAVGEDVARVVAFLCHPFSGQVNGTVVEVNGGYDILHTNWKDRK
jgi:3-oxoacyl-[acyl-carrier protein] reductase